jgi:hypothetical protein
MLYFASEFNTSSTLLAPFPVQKKRKENSSRRFSIAMIGTRAKHMEEPEAQRKATTR